MTHLATPRRSLIRSIVALASLPWTALAFAQGSAKAGEVVKLNGNVQTERGGARERTSTGSPVRAGDIIHTQEQSEAVIKLTDGSVVAVRPSSSLDIAAYQYQQSKSSDGVAMQLIRGGMRVVTGLIGKANPSAYKVTTNTATVGIRGTDFEVIVREDSEDGVEAGTYNQVFSGETVFTTDGKTIGVRQGQTAFVHRDPAKRARALELLKNAPSIFGKGRYDNLLDSIRQETTQQLQRDLDSIIPGELKGKVPSNARDLLNKKPRPKPGFEQTEE